ncbi:MAG: hypothetical protein M3P46_11815 [Actinomycetota bacterium]|nr:hypothetical protein [Actinomycetota bacterium]
MDIVLLYFDACPNWRLAGQRLRSVLRELRHEPVTPSDRSRVLQHR